MKGLFSACENSNPTPEAARKMMGQAPAGLFGYSHLTGGIPGGQAEYLRVPFADIGPIKIPSGLADEKVLFLSDILPTGYMAAENCALEGGDTVAIWGCGPVGQMAILSAWLLGAGRVIAVDRVPERLEMARRHGKAETINFEEDDVQERLMQMTQGRGPDACIDAVGAEAHTRGSFDAVLDKVKQKTYLGTDRPHVLREAIMCCRKGGTVSVPGVYIGLLDKIPFGAAMNKGLSIKTGQTHVPRYSQDLLAKIEAQEIDPSFIVTHRLGLEQAPDAYKMFRDKQDGCIKVVLTPWH
jgi:threonine dehydrogenase-like Zn-dependent dehydrogenase